MKSNLPFLYDIQLLRGGSIETGGSVLDGIHQYRTVNSWQFLYIASSFKALFVRSWLPHSKRLLIKDPTICGVHLLDVDQNKVSHLSKLVDQPAEIAKVVNEWRSGAAAKVNH